MRSTFHRILWPAAMVAAAGCGELALNTDQEPAILELTPEDTLMTAGDAAQLEVLVFDRDHNPLPGPGHYGRSLSEGRWRAGNAGQSRRKGPHAVA